MDNVRYAFQVDWHDSRAELDRAYELFYYPADQSIEMYDPKQKRTFLKRSKSDLKLRELFIGAAINVHARQLLIRNFADSFTRKELSSQMESSLLILKPNGASNFGNVLETLYGAQFILSRMRYLKFQNADGLLNESIVDSDTRSNVTNGGASIIFEVLKSGAVESLLSLVKEKYSSICYAPSNLKDAEKLMKKIFEKVQSLPRTATMKDCTICVLRPHAITSGDAGKIVNHILNAGYTISDMELFHLDRANAEDFLEVYKGVVPEYHLMVSQLTAGPIIAMEITGKGPNTVKDFREFVGPTDPALAKHIRPNSLRAIFGQDKVMNAIHCTDLTDDGVLEHSAELRINSLKLK